MYICSTYPCRFEISTGLNVLLYTNNMLACTTIITWYSDYQIHTFFKNNTL